MPIKEVFNHKTKETTWTVRVSLTSKVDPSIRVQLRRKGVKDKKTAIRVEKELLAQAHRKVIEREEKGMLWPNFVERWIQAVKGGDILARSMTPKALEDYIRVLQQYTDHWNRHFVGEIDKPMVWQLLAKIETTISKARMERTKSALTRIFEWGITTGQISHLKDVPTKGYQSKTRKEEKMPEVLSVDEIKRLLVTAENLDHPWFPVWAMALFTGMRSGELYALNWSNVDMVNRQIFVKENWTSKTGIGPTKGRCWREVPINDELFRILKKLKLQRRASEFVLPRFKAWEQGRQAEILRQFCMEAGISSIKFHALRASFATQLMRDGVATVVVMKICGWKDLKTTLKYLGMAGIETKGATNSLKFLNPTQVGDRVSELFVTKGASKGP